MNLITLFIILILHSNAFAKAAKSKNNNKEIPNKIQEEIRDTKQKAVILILDKLYTNRSFYDVEIGNSIATGDIEIKALNCVENAQKQQFILLKITQNGDDIFNQWIPILKHTSTPIAHKRFDITAISCNFYNQKT